MKNRNTFLKLLSFLSLVACSSENPVITGTVDDQDTSIPGLVSPVGTPVENAKIRIYEARDTSGIALDSTYTDSNGKYDISGLPEGDYSIWAESDSQEFVFFKDSIFISDSVQYTKTDTMDAPRKILIPVKLQEQHMDRVEMVRSHILGTHIYPVVNKQGFLTLEKIPSGNFPLRLYVDEFRYEYTPQTFDIEIDSTSPDTLSDTLELAYTGVPVVTGISAEYDTLTGDVTVTWDPATSVTVESYRIFRDHEGVIEESTTAIGSSQGTSFTENLKGSGLEAGCYYYRVKIYTKNEEVGIGYHKAFIDFVDPEVELNTIFETKFTANVNEEISLPLTISKWYGNSPTITYKLGNEEEVDISGKSSISINTGSKYRENVPLVVSITGEETETVKDTIILNVTHQWYSYGNAPTQSGTYLSPTLFNGQVIQPVHQDNRVRFFSSSDSCKTWNEISSGVIESFDTSMVSNPVVRGDSLWIVGGNGLLYSSIDGINWNSESSEKFSTGWSNPDSRTYSLDIINDSIHVVFDEHSSFFGTTTYFQLYNDVSKSFETIAELDEIPSISHYWLTRSSNSFEYYVLHKNSTNRSIDHYSQNDSALSLTGTVYQSSTDLTHRSSISMRLSSASYGEGILLADGAGRNKILYIDSENKTISFNDHSSMSEPVNLFVLGETLFSINSDGVFSNKKSSN